MTNDELKKEFRTRAFFGETLEDETYNQIADWWLSKLDAYKSELVEQIEGINKYSEDLFSEPPVGWQADIDKFAEGMGYRIDNISAHFARWQEKIVKNDIINLIKEEK